MMARAFMDSDLLRVFCIPITDSPRHSFVGRLTCHGAGNRVTVAAGFSLRAIGSVLFSVERRLKPAATDHRWLGIT